VFWRREARGEKSEVEFRETTQMNKGLAATKIPQWLVLTRALKGSGGGKISKSCLGLFCWVLF